MAIWERSLRSLAAVEADVKYHDTAAAVIGLSTDRLVISTSTTLTQAQKDAIAAVKIWELVQIFKFVQSDGTVVEA